MKFSRKQVISIFRGLYRLLADTEYYNEEILPKEGPYILAMNHLSLVDFPALCFIKRWEDVVPLAAKEYLNYPFFGKLLRDFGTIYIDRSCTDFSALRAAFGVLKEGKILTLAPEGTRSKTGGLNEGKEGIGLIAAKAGVPVCTVSVAGTYQFKEEIKRFRRPRFVLRFGPAFEMPEIDRENREASMRAATDEVMCRIAALLPKELRGVYADFPRVAELIAQYKQAGELQLPE